MLGVTGNKRLRFRRFFPNKSIVGVKNELVTSPRTIRRGKCPTNLWEVLALMALIVHWFQGFEGVGQNEFFNTSFREICFVRKSKGEVSKRKYFWLEFR